MSRTKGFTLVELLVVIAIIALLMSILMPTLSRVKIQAKAVICQANLKQWGSVFLMYTGDNDGYFQDRVWFDDSSSPWLNPLCFGGHSWPTTLLPYYKNTKLRFCPMATKTYYQGAPLRFAAWFQLDNTLPTNAQEFVAAGSYGMNSWIVKTDLGYTDENYWKTPNVKEAHDIPLLLDAWWPAGFPTDTDGPPAYDGEASWGGEIVRFCINRHEGFVNGVFVDWSVRKIGLKQLWTLKWHRTFRINGPWTIAGGVTYSDWANYGTGWMKDFKDY
jgi:prepilin-type N-terminal cleavage/methylation domain-containing protein